MTTAVDRGASASGAEPGGEFQELDVAFEDMTVHCFEAGEGRPIVLLHGSGAGAATLSNFRRVMGPLARTNRVLAADLVGFGQSGLKSRPPYFDMDLWVRQVRFLLDRVGSGAICVGHSLSGAIVLKVAAQDPRIAAVVTTATMGWTDASANAAADGSPRWRFPATRDEVKAAVERTFFDPALAEESEIDRRLRVLERDGYREYFEAMFDGPGSRYMTGAALTEEELGRVSCPVALLHGVADRSFSPNETSIPISHRLRYADVHILAACAHSVAHERPHDFLAVVRSLEERLDLSSGT